MVVSRSSHGGVEGPGNDLQLLVTGELAEVHGVATHTDGQVGVLLRVLHSIHQHLLVQHIAADTQQQHSKAIGQAANTTYPCHSMLAYKEWLVLPTSLTSYPLSTFLFLHSSIIPF